MLLFSFYGGSLLAPLLLVFCFNNWVAVWACLEVMTILFVILLSYSLSPRVVESMAKYFITQAVASLVVFFGALLQYLSKGKFKLMKNYEGLPYVIILVGLFVKVAVFPKPFWFVDVVSGVSLLRASYMIIVSKMVPIYLFIVMGVLDLRLFLLAAGLLSVTVGSVLGMNQTSIRKMVALSSIAHLGWLMAGLPYLQLSSCIFIFLCYLIMVLPLLWVAGVYQVDDLKSMKRLYSRPYFLSFLLLSLLKLAGFPPLVGFFYKWTVFVGLLAGGEYLVGGYLMMMSLISLYFYLRLCLSLVGVYWPESKVSLLQAFSDSRLSWGPLWVLLSSAFLFTTLGSFGVGGLTF